MQAAAALVAKGSLAEAEALVLNKGLVAAALDQGSAFVLAAVLEQLGRLEVGANLVRPHLRHSLLPVELHIAARIEAKLGATDTALGLLRRALAQDPDAVECAVTLAGLLRRTGDSRAARAVVEGFLRRRPRTISLLRMHADLLARDGETAEAVANYELIVASREILASDRHALCGLYLAQGRPRDGIRLLLDARRNHRWDEKRLLLLQNCLLRLGKPRGALAVAALVRRLWPGNQQAILLQAQALSLLDPAQAPILSVREIRRLRLENLIALAAASEVRLTLRGQLLSAALDPTVSVTEADGRVFLPDIAIVAPSCAASLRDAISASALQSFGDFFSASSPPQVEMWATILSSGQQHQVHLHEGALLSGVYFVDPVEGDDISGGDLFFDSQMGLGGEPVVVSIQRPVPGTLLIFPAWYPHGTRPFHSRGERISIGFDIRRGS